MPLIKSYTLLINYHKNISYDHHFSFPTWTYGCENNKCVRRPSASVFQANDSFVDSDREFAGIQGLSTCKMTCGEKANLWPYPTGLVNLSDTTFNFLPVR